MSLNSSKNSFVSQAFFISLSLIVLSFLIVPTQSLAQNNRGPSNQPTTGDRQRLPRISTIDSPAGMIPGGVYQIGITLVSNSRTDPTVEFSFSNDGNPNVDIGIFTPSSGTIDLSGSTDILSVSYTAPSTSGRKNILFTLSTEDGLLTRERSFPLQVVQAPAPSIEPPTISGTPSNSVEVDSNYSFVPTASDPDGDELSFFIVNQPVWATFDIATGALTGIPQAGDEGLYDGVEITVSDGEFSASIAPFSIMVTERIGNHAPTISGIANNSVETGSGYSFIPTASDPDGDDLIFSIENQPSWTAFSEFTGALTGNPGAGDVGLHDNILISVSDGDLSASLAPFSIEVIAAQDPGQAPSFRALTYNIRIGMGDAWLVRLPFVMESIETNQPDFIGFQEAYSAHNSTQQDTLAAAFDGTKWTVYRWDDSVPGGNENNKNPIALNTDRYQHIASGVYVLDISDEETGIGYDAFWDLYFVLHAKFHGEEGGFVHFLDEFRFLNWVVAEDRSNGERIVFLTTHYETFIGTNNLGPDEDADFQIFTDIVNESFGNLSKLIAEIAEDLKSEYTVAGSNIETIIVGDFETGDPALPSQAEYYSAGYVEAYTDLYPNWRNDRSLSRPTQGIDNIFIKKDNVEIISAFYDDDPQNLASDHDAYYADFDIQ